MEVNNELLENANQCGANEDSGGVCVLHTSNEIFEDSRSSGNDQEDSEHNNILHTIVAELVDSSSESDDEIYQLLAGNSDSEDAAVIEQILKVTRRTPRNCIKNYFECVVPTYTDKEFVTHFRITRELFNNLAMKYEGSNVYRNLRSNKRFSADKSLALFLWFAGHEACSFRDLADRFDLTISSVSRTIERLTVFISRMSPECIKWPSTQRKQETANYFAKFRFSKAQVKNFKND
ncbi:uncharacterized protein LOC118741569 [Rhagoletis pomonella]|uniref:uncharacterized protein LOC118741569 n=1 Tax=Rhagoletis pomonella TaxID=28610 RepID=UPI001782B03E|nr:uncharacterized protein LOC118741569 [Rhagoletis pomonella]